MEKYNYIIKRRFYPGQKIPISPSLPQGYKSSESEGVPNGQNCESCFFNQNGFCDYWKSTIRDDYWCAKWSRPNQSSYPSPPPCLRETNFKIIITEDYNDIGVYTPFDGLVVQRDVVNNFVYVASGLRVTVYNTSDLEFRSFLTFSNYNIDWGDGTNSVLNVQQTQQTHSYNSPGSYTITLTQINPWGTTKVSKKVLLPYTDSVNIVNPFGTIEFQPPNVGDPISCEKVTQNYIFDGDSEPDVYNYLSSNFVDTPFPVTGFTSNSRLQLLLGYGPNSVPPTGTTVQGIDGISGEIINLNDSFTAYTINNIIYYDYPNGETFFEALSTGINLDNVEYKCCDDTVGDDCDCDEFGKVIKKGEYNPNLEYVRGTTVRFGDCCYYCNPKTQNNFSCKSEPFIGSDEWVPCLPCTENATVGDRVQSVVDEYNPAIGYEYEDVVSFQGTNFRFEGTKVLDESGSSGTTYNGTSGYIDLTYEVMTTTVAGYNVPEITPYQDQNGIWIGGFTTYPLFDPQDWENKSGNVIEKYSLWTQI